VKPAKRAKLGKDPSVNTSFLPDREREEAEHIENEKKLDEWRKRQAEIKAETVDVQFAYYDGLSHLGSVTVKKGEAIFNLIDKAKKAFPAIRDIPADRLLFAKDDIIIPHEMSLYYFEANQVKGKYGLLFEFYDPENQGRLRNKNDVCSLFELGVNGRFDWGSLSRASMRTTVSIYSRSRDGSCSIRRKTYLRPSQSMLTYSVYQERRVQVLEGAGSVSSETNLVY
jgi:hypothetical protein